MEFPDWDSQPWFVAHDVDSVVFEFAELTDAHPGSGQHLNTKPSDQHRFGGEGPHELRVVAVVEELW